MLDKINEYPIERPLTPEHRSLIDQFIKTNAAGFGRVISSQWDESGQRLALASDPVKCEFLFYPDKVEAFASLPFWMKMLLTDQRRQQMDQIVTQMLEQAGLIGKAGADENSQR